MLFSGSMKALWLLAASGLATSLRLSVEVVIDVPMNEYRISRDNKALVPLEYCQLLPGQTRSSLLAAYSAALDSPPYIIQRLSWISSNSNPLVILSHHNHNHNHKESE